MLQHYIHKTATLEKVVRNVVRYTSDMSLDPRVIHETLSGIGEGIGSTVREAGNALEHIIITEQKGFRDGLNSLLTGPVQLIFNILIVLIILVVLGYVGYLLILARCKRTRVEYVPPTGIQRSNSYRNSFATALVRLNEMQARKQKVKDEIETGEELKEFVYKGPECSKRQPSCCLIQRKSVNSLRTPHIEILLNKTVKACALIDTVAVFSLVDETILDKLENIQIKETMLKPVAANGYINVLGTIFLTISVSDVEETILVFVQQNCAADIILGKNRQ